MAGAIAGAQPPAATDERDSWHGDFTRLAGQYRAAERVEMADRVAAWDVAPIEDRQLLYLPKPPLESELRDSDDPLDRQFRSLKMKRAKSFWREAQTAAETGDFTTAYRLMNLAWRDDPNHPQARRALSLLEPDESIRVLKATGREKRLGWPAGHYWRAYSAHFSVVTDSNEANAESIARLFEAYHSIWRQLFVCHWTNARAIDQALEGRPLRWSGRRRHRVVLFADRDEFVRQLKKFEPRIELAMGVYRDKDQTTYLYVGDPSLRSTWIHELTHQLFQESNVTRLDVAAASNFWMVEAIAMYCESVQFLEGYCWVGGCDAPRLQTARFRQRNERYYMPLAQLSELSKQDLQQHGDIRRLYTQSAGLAHFLMDGRDGEYRQRFVEKVSALYRRPGETFPLWEALGLPAHRIDDQYAAYLDVRDGDLHKLPNVNRMEQLSLGFTQVTDEGLQALRNATQLRWLDLSGLPITDVGLASLSDCTALKRLTLAGTPVTDVGLAQLKQCGELEELDLSGTHVTDACLMHLAEYHPELKSLWLSNTAVSANGVKALAKLNQLTELDIDGTQINPSEWNDLKRKYFPRLAAVDRNIVPP